MIKRKAIFLAVNYFYKNKKTYAKLFVKGKKTTSLLYQYDPYFYIDAVEKRQEIANLKIKKNSELVEVKNVEIIEKIVGNEKKKLLKVYCNKPSDVVVLRSVLPFKCYEQDIPYTKRFILDFNITPFAILEYERQGAYIKNFLKVYEDEESLSKIKLNKTAFDIETYNPLGTPREEKDPIIMISYAVDKKTKGVFIYKDNKKNFVHTSKNEKEMLIAFEKKIYELAPDIVFGYNSSNFDLPYLYARAQALKINSLFGKKSNEFKRLRKGIIKGAELKGMLHIDLYPVVRFFGFIGLLKTHSFTLEKVYEELVGKKKKMITRLNIWEMWDKGELDELVEYSLGDAEATFELGEAMLPLLMELSKLASVPIFDASLSTSGQFVESLIMHKSQLRNKLIPPKPSEFNIIERQKNPVQGAFVKLPEPGIYENLVVVDFRGLYPSIIISYNIDPDTLTTNETDVFTSPTNAKFLKKEKGLIPSALEHLVDMRIKIKKALKKADKESIEYKKLYARSHALKILANSFYGYLGYARSRWYNRACAESITAWGRKHILDASSKAKAAGFQVLYNDTDSLFLLLGEKKKQDAIAFLETINKELPEKMELELENFYSRGVFVSKKQKEEKGAKKKYALLAEDGKIKIRGFELVRRDWSAIAKHTQFKVLETILKQGSKEEAAKIVKETIEKLKSGKIPLKDLVIYTQLTKKPEDYDIISPELAAAKKALRRGISIEKGSMIAYIITKTGKSISEKAEIADYAKDYDPDYYINNQVLPAVMKILKELGYNEDDLKNKGRQQNLNSFFD